MARRPVLRSALLHLVSAATLLSGLATASASPASEPFPWCSRLLVAEPPDQDGATTKPVATAKAARVAGLPEITGELPRTQARWDLEVFGPIAVGTLTETFESRLTRDVEGVFVLRKPPGATLGELAIELETADGHVEELEAAEPMPLELERPAGRGGRSAGNPQRVSQVKRSPVLRVPAEGRVRVTTSVELALGFDTGSFELALPSLTSECLRRQTRLPGQGSSDLADVEVLVQVYRDEGEVQVESPTHELALRDEYDRTRVELLDPAPSSEPVRLRYRIGDQERALLNGFVGAQRDDGSRDLLLVLTPPAMPRQEAVRARDVVFVLDTSGSMTGMKITEARNALGACLGSLGDEDSFGILRFAGDVGQFGDALVGASPGQKEVAGDWLADLKTRGSTRLLHALRRALELAESGQGHPLVVLITDGAIQDEAPVLDLLGSNAEAARLLVVGISAEPAAEIIHRLAEHGRGDATFAPDPSTLVAAMTRLFESFSAPVAWDLTLDWGGAEVELVAPKRLPDLYGGRPVTVRARVHGAAPNLLTLRGTTVDGPAGLVTDLPLGQAAEHEGLRLADRREREANRRR